MNVLIVGRTKMGSHRCIGAVDDNNRSLRLLPPAGVNWTAGVNFQIGQIWDVTLSGVQNIIQPHTEDVIAIAATHVGQIPNMSTHLLTRVSPWRGGIERLFDGHVRYTGNGNGYISARSGVPAYSTWFWIPDRDLHLRADGKHYEYRDGFSRGLVYVGEPAAIPLIVANTLVRVSLARWWRPSDAEATFEERCYVQLSGWY